MQDMKLTDQFSRHLQGMQLQDVKMKDQYAGHEIAGHDKKLSYCWDTVRRENMPRIDEMDAKMTT